MTFDDLYDEKYYIVHDDGSIENGWMKGIRLTQEKGSPQVDMVPEGPLFIKLNYINSSMPLRMNELWPDTIDYDQNSPGIINRAKDLDDRWFASDIEKALYLNVLRVPICASYLAACAKVLPRTILELGTGGDSAHSTGIFLYWLKKINVQTGGLVSVDRHYLSHAWLRYRDYDIWTFIQGDSISVMKAIKNGKIRVFFHSWVDMIFIDSSHTYPHTKMELVQAAGMTNAILMDDSTVPDVAKSKNEFLAENPDWLSFDLAHGVTLLERHEKI